MLHFRLFATFHRVICFYSFLSLELLLCGVFKIIFIIVNKMADKRKRGQNFTCDEKDRLIKLLMDHKETILNKKTDGSTNEAKQKAWISVAERFNTMGPIYRTKESLMKIWEKLKTDSKLYYSASRQDTIRTGGGPSIVKIDPILEQVCVILGRSCTGILGVSDSDATEDCKSFTEMHDFPKALCLTNESATINMVDLPNQIVNTVDLPNQIVNIDLQEIASSQNIEMAAEEAPRTTPLWSRRRPQHSQPNERTEALSSLCNSFKDVNKQKESIEELKRTLLLEEIDFKRKLYELQLHSAEKEVEIKNEVVLGLIKSGVLKPLQNL